MTLTKEIIIEALIELSEAPETTPDSGIYQVSYQSLDTLSKLARALHESWDDLAAMEWQPIETAPSDVSVLLKLRDDLEKFKTDEPERWNGLEFVGRRRSDNHDLFGWSFAAPVGMGGFPDQWFVGWKHINSPILKRLIGEV